MSKALRGDFERLRDRGVATTLAPKDDQRPEPVPDEVVAAAPEADREPEAHEPEALTAPEPERTEDAAGDVPVAEGDEPRGSWLDRLLGR